MMLSSSAVVLAAMARSHRTRTRSSKLVGGTATEGIFHGGISGGGARYGVFCMNDWLTTAEAAGYLKSAPWHALEVGPLWQDARTPAIRRQAVRLEIFALGT